MIPYSRQPIEDDDIAAVTRVLRSDFLTNGQEVVEFERELAAFCGSRYAVVCANGTAALHLASLALGVGPSDSVVTSPITFMASGNAALYCGAEVRFADVEPHSICLSVTRLAAAVDALPRAPKMIVPVHYGGGAAEMVEISRLARDMGSVVLEDACHALGSTYPDENGQPVKVGACRHSDAAAFSFHPLKHITAGEGGAVTTNREDIYRKLLTLRSHGIVRDSSQWIEKEQGFTDGKPNPWYHEMQSLGFNYRLTDIQSALGRSQLKKIDRFLNKRRSLADLYRTVLAETNSPALPLFAHPATGNSYHLFPALIPFEERGTSRAQVMAKLMEAGIQTQVHYIPVYRQPHYRGRYGYAPEDFPEAERYYSQCLSLPVFPLMRDEDVHTVVAVLNSIL